METTGAEATILPGDSTVGPLQADTLELFLPSGERGIWVRDNSEQNLVEMFDGVYRQTGAAPKAGVIWSGPQLTTQRVDRPQLGIGSKAERPPLDQDRRPLPRPRRTPP